MAASRWITLAPLGAALGFFVVTMLIFGVRCATHGVPRTERIAARGRSPFLSTWFMEWYYWLIRPATRLLSRIGVSPNAVTAVSIVPAFVAGGLFWLGHYAAAGWMYLLCGTLDLLDGHLARETGRVSRAGAFFDSTLDRYAELAVYIGLLVNLRASLALIIAAGALAGSLMTSYTKARGQALGVDAPPGGMQRAERVTCLGVAAVLSPLADLVSSGGGRLLVVASLAAIALSSNWTAVRRAAHVFKTLQKTRAAPKSL